MNPSKITPRYKRILLKISGESFGTQGVSNLEQANNIVEEIVKIHKQKVEIGLVIGGGNIIRGGVIAKSGISRVIGDYMGMLATVINGLLLQELLNKAGAKTKLMTSKVIEGIGEIYQYQKCLDYFSRGNIVIFAGGTGNPYFTTDTTAALRAAEISADCFFKATKVDGVYSDDPIVNPNATKFDNLTYQDVLIRSYKAMDITAISFCMENKIPIFVFNLLTKGNLLKAIQGEKIGTLISF